MCTRAQMRSRSGILEPFLDPPLAEEAELEEEEEEEEERFFSICFERWREEETFTSLSTPRAKSRRSLFPISSSTV